MQKLGAHGGVDRGSDQGTGKVHRGRSGLEQSQYRLLITEMNPFQ